jgi:hypothetical protein
MKPGRKEKARRIAMAVVKAAKSGEIWAARALADSMEGTLNGQLPPIDQEALLLEGLSVRETVKRIRQAYTRH